MPSAHGRTPGALAALTRSFTANVAKLTAHLANAACARRSQLPVNLAFVRDVAPCVPGIRPTSVAAYPVGTVASSDANKCSLKEIVLPPRSLRCTNGLAATQPLPFYAGLCNYRLARLIERVHETIAPGAGAS